MPMMDLCWRSSSNMMVLPSKDLTAKALADAAVVAVTNAMQHAEQRGFEHPLARQGEGRLRARRHCTISSQYFQVSCCVAVPSMIFNRAKGTTR